MTATENQRTIGTSILAILTAQAGLLALFLSGSVYLQAQATTSSTEWGLNGLMMLIIGMAYLTLAYGLWGIQRWARLFSYITLLIVLAAGIVNTLDNNMMDLGFVLVFFICCAINFVVSAWFILSGIRKQARAAE